MPTLTDSRPNDTIQGLTAANVSSTTGRDAEVLLIPKRPKSIGRNTVLATGFHNVVVSLKGCHVHRFIEMEHVVPDILGTTHRFPMIHNLQKLNTINNLSVFELTLTPT